MGCYQRNNGSDQKVYYNTRDFVEEKCDRTDVKRCLVREGEIIADHLIMICLSVFFRMSPVTLRERPKIEFVR